MGRTRLRTKLVLSLIFTTALLTGASLLVVQNHLRTNARNEIQKQIPNSFVTFDQYMVQRRELSLQSTKAAAALTSIQEVMTTRHEKTIEDALAEHWQNTDCDLMLLAAPDGRIMGLHATDEVDRKLIHASLLQTTQQHRSRDWWFQGGRLYEVFVQPIYRGPLEEGNFEGVLVKGYAVNQAFAATIAQITSSHVAFSYGNKVVASSLPVDRQQDLTTWKGLISGQPPSAPEDIPLSGEMFVAASTGLPPFSSQPIMLTFLRSYDEATSYLQQVNQLLIAVGLVALIAGSLLMFLIAHRLTRPLSKLSSGVVALEKGDFSYPLHLGRQDEVGELTLAFEKMRKSLKDSQQHLLHAERLATIGRMASSISLDLRHPLTTVLAYAELLSESNLDDRQRAEMYQQIRSSVNNMAELIGSLLEFSKAQEAVRLTYGDCVETLQDTIRSVRMKPEFRGIELTLLHEGHTQGWFDFAKLERVFINLLKNACEAVEPEAGSVRIVALGSRSRVEISISDNGPGIPETIRDEVFQPFVTFGKAEGTGLGLAVVQKIVLDHGGEVAVESTGSQGTTFKLILPLTSAMKPSVR